MTMGFGDMAEIKKRAEAGDAQAQVILGKALEPHQKWAEALAWFREAATQGNADGQYELGHMLLYSSPTNRVEGLQWTYLAATHDQALAMFDMSEALRLGSGTVTNMIAAYAWMELFSETPSGVLGRVQMNEMALTMSTSDLQRAQSLAAEFKTGHWQRPVLRIIPEDDPHFRLTGVASGMKEKLAIIDGKTFSEGQSSKVRVNALTITVKCLKIEKDSALVMIDGEESPRQLQLSQFSK